MAERASAKVIDLTNVKDGGNFNKRRVPAGDYPARITKVEDTKAKEDGGFMWLFTITTDSGGTYPYYCKLVENQLWKVRNLCLAAGLNVPKKRLKLDPEKLVGKKIAVTLEDGEYEGKKQSEINATFPLSELDHYGSDDEGLGDDADDDDDDDEVAPPPVKKASKKKAAPEPEPEDDDEDEDEDEDEVEVEDDELAGLDRDQLKRRLRKAVPGVSVSRKQSDDDLRAAIRAAEGSDDEDEDDDDEEEPPPPKKSKKAKKKSIKVEDVDEEELDELDIDEI